MSDLFAWFQNYLNLSKLTAISVPGMIVAFALILILGPIPCPNNAKSCPFCSANLKPSASVPPANPAQPIPVSDTVIVSKAKWLPSILVPRVEIPHPAPGSAAEQDEKSLAAAVAQIKAACEALPMYVVANSRSAPAKTPGGNGSSAQPTKSGPQYSDEETVPYQAVLSESYTCAGQLTALDQWLQARIAQRQSLTTQEAADLQSFSTSLASAQGSGDRLVARDLSAQVAEKKSELQGDQVAAKWLTQADSYVQGLETQVKTLESQLQSQMTPIGTTANTSTAGTVFDTIQQNIIMFLLFSLILGQILDPIQRGLMSFTGPRRWIFKVFNVTYGLHGRGEFRYGDRRLPPWTREPSYLPKAAADLPIQHSAADLRYLKDMNVYNENYAVASGFLTQSEYRTIHDEFYSQSQITSGLILPFFIFSFCLGIRYICCSAAAADGKHAAVFLCCELLAMGVGLVAGVPLARLVNTGIRRAREATRVRERNEKDDSQIDRNDDYGDDRFLAVASERRRSGQLVLNYCGYVCIGLCLALLIIALFAAKVSGEIQYVTGIAPLDELTIITPCLAICSLWIAGLDRLHKYYSEVQSRIAGNILRQEANTEKKLIDLLTDPRTRGTVRDQLAKTRKEQAEFAKFIDEYSHWRDSATSQASAAQPDQAEES